ncbi:helix-turn-helix domain-containing protein [Kaistia dalseonensis]|uniref:AraC-like DNA-binding protein n=1 Tax=Kaistia dalseonensis TaxID=410840 RepID=A0ABU0H7R6_9HYPH|nr:helix-turn-helix domain-containing protein [Kaistia dalseonensis]MCX5495748.1 helix-turn-helix domain-containing protein [Kaistia dalseonensis]MDQ0438347.1 AraC-like DNA-binding protein [Kaistia dalseonensis]
MATSIPLIRAAPLQIILRWLDAQGRPAGDRLRAVDLAYVARCSAELPIPLLPALRLLRLLALVEGPDIAARIISQSNVADFGNFGRVILGSDTPRHALNRIVAALPRYSTHEYVAVEPIAGGLCVRVGWSLVLDDERMHLSQQFAASLVCGLYAATCRGQTPPRSLRMRRHPDFGIEHLRPLLGPSLASTDAATLEIDLDDAVLDAPLSFGAKGLALPDSDWVPLRGDGSFNHSARLVLAAMVIDPPVTIQRLALAAGMSSRSLQRVLTAEGTNFRRLRDETHEAKALGALKDGYRNLSAVAGHLGYSEQSSLSRAVRRWTGAPPGHIASKG